MKYLVTGGAGFIGSNIVNSLVDAGHGVIVIDNESSDSHEYFHYNEAYRFIGTDKNLFRSAIENNIIAIDIRMRTQNTIGKSIRNRGTAFRMNHGDMEALFVKENLIV